MLAVENPMPVRHILCIVGAIACALMAAAPVDAHKGGILIQAQQGKLVTGFDNESTGIPTIGDRAFGLLFPSSLANDVPSFLSLRTPPIGSEALPMGTELFWDFLPMHIDGTTSNLMYWNPASGHPSEPSFAPATGGATLSIWTQNFIDKAVVDGAPDIVPGKSLGTVTDNATSLHAHRWFFMESAGTVPQGIYLVALQVRAEGYLATDPFFVVAATDQIAASTLDNIALPWVDARASSLILEGDFNFDGSVDAGDYVVWRNTLDSTGPGHAADANGDLVVNELDYGVWKENFGTSTASGGSPTLSSVPVPEPDFAMLWAISLIWAMTRRTRPRV